MLKLADSTTSNIQFYAKIGPLVRGFQLSQSGSMEILCFRPEVDGWERGERKIANTKESLFTEMLKSYVLTNNMAESA